MMTTTENDVQTVQSASIGNDKKDRKWFVMHAYLNERKAKETLSHERHGLEHFIPMEKVVRTFHGKKTVCDVPVIRSLVFVHATHEEIIHFKQNYYNKLQFVMSHRDGYKCYLTVPDKQMDSFMLVYTQKEEAVTFYKLGDETLEEALKKGDRVHIHGGRLDGLEGYVLKVRGKRSKQIIVVIPDALAISTAQVNDGIVEVIEEAKTRVALKARGNGMNITITPPRIDWCRKICAVCEPTIPLRDTAILL